MRMHFAGKVFVFVGFARNFLMVLQVLSVHLKATLSHRCTIEIDDICGEDTLMAKI